MFFWGQNKIDRKAASDIISQYYAAPTGSLEKMHHKMTILTTLSRNPSAKAYKFVRREFAKIPTKHNPSYLFDIVKDILSRNDLRYKDVLSDFFGKGGAYSRRWWSGSDDNDLTGSIRSDHNRTFGQLKKMYQQSDFINT